MNSIYQNLFDVDLVTDDKYSVAVGVPQYLPQNRIPDISELYSDKKYNQLMRDIEASDTSDDIKAFLRLAATRHIVFDYSNIADYYAHAPANVQKLFEDSALVLVDINDAIANGYVKFSSKIEEIMERTGKHADSSKNIHMKVMEKINEG